MLNVLTSLPGFLQPASAGAAVPGRDLPRAVSTLLIAVTVVLSSVHVSPFLDLQSVDILEKSQSGNTISQIAYTVLFLAALAAISVVGFRRLAPLATPLNLCLLGWIVVSTVLSTQPVVSARKLALTFMCMFLGVAILLLARSVKHFARTLAITAFWILLISYVSVAIAPDFTIHSRLDVREPDLAGDWRGPFEHKNEAGPIMVLFVFVGLLAYGTGSRMLGATVAIASMVFLGFTQSKTAIALLPLVLLQVRLARVFTGTLTRALVLFGPLALLGTVSLGSFFIKPLQELLGEVMPNANFTGRTEIWQLAVDNIIRRPITGWGFSGFWRTEAAESSGSGVDLWVIQADHAHNSYLDLALFMGIPGLILTLAAFVALPFRDLQNAAGGRQMDAVTAFFLSLWLYTLSTCFFETVLFMGNGLLFILFITAVCGLRFRTLAQAVAR